MAAGLGNVRESKARQSVEASAHIMRRSGTLRERRKTRTKTNDRPSRTVRPFIWPSVGRFSRSSPVRPSFFPEARCPALARDGAPSRPGTADEGGIECRAAKEGS
jgi:hypothetical protein